MRLERFGTSLVFRGIDQAAIDAAAAELLAHTSASGITTEEPQVAEPTAAASEHHVGCRQVACRERSEQDVFAARQDHHGIGRVEQ